MQLVVRFVDRELSKDVLQVYIRRVIRLVEMAHVETDRLEQTPQERCLEGPNSAPSIQL
jgi:hypothetical protein